MKRHDLRKSFKLRGCWLTRWRDSHEWTHQFVLLQRFARPSEPMDEFEFEMFKLRSHSRRRRDVQRRFLGGTGRQGSACAT